MRFIASVLRVTPRPPTGGSQHLGNTGFLNFWEQNAPGVKHQ